MEQIAEALYVLNKEAKKQRDIQQEVGSKIYDEGQRTGHNFKALNDALQNKEYLYNKKEEFLRKIINAYGFEPVGYHIINDLKQDMYTFGGYNFHTLKNISNNFLGHIEDIIPADKTDGKMSCGEAMGLLDKMFVS